jgi:urease
MVLLQFFISGPISSVDGDVAGCLYGTFLPIPSLDLFPTYALNAANVIIPGQVIVSGPNISLNQGRKRVCLSVTNNGDRPIQVGSHYHFIETNPFLNFDRESSYGFRLDIAAGTAVRFEPGESKLANLVEIGGLKVISGGNGLASGPLDQTKKQEIVKRLVEKGFQHSKQSPILATVSPCTMSRQRYADAYGPTGKEYVK